MKRVYDEPSADDGTRVLVDRVWPRGQRKDDAHLDEWLKSVAPSTELRKWFGHVPERYDEFAARYARELAAGEPADAFEHLRELADAGPLTLLTATKQWQISQAAVGNAAHRPGSGRRATRTRRASRPDAKSAPPVLAVPGESETEASKTRRVRQAGVST